MQNLLIWRIAMKITGHENYIVTDSGEVINTNTNQAMKKQLNNCGYYRVALSKSGKTKRHFVHRLVASAYLENKGNLPQVNHINGNKLDNHVKNLEWCTASDNHKHSFKHLNRPVTKVFDTDNGKTKIKKEDIPRLIEIKKTSTYRSMALVLGVHPKYLSSLLRGLVRG
jgi:hypothetical protein